MPYSGRDSASRRGATSVDAPPSNAGCGTTASRVSWACVNAASVNPIDNMIPTGLFKAVVKFQLPATLGSDLAGVVTDIAAAATTVTDPPASWADTTVDLTDTTVAAGDTFYAHMDEEATKGHPFFPGRVAHGYLLLSFAAGLFVDPDPGPVLANYGLDSLRFIKPIQPGETIKVRLTAKDKSPRNKQYGEVRWDVEILTDKDESAATYELLTMNAVRPAA